MTDAGFSDLTIDSDYQLGPVNDSTGLPVHQFSHRFKTVNVGSLELILKIYPDTEMIRSVHLNQTQKDVFGPEELLQYQYVITGVSTVISDNPTGEGIVSLVQTLVQDTQTYGNSKQEYLGKRYDMSIIQLNRYILIIDNPNDRLIYN